MTTSDAVAASELRVTVEMGDDYTPSDDVQTALDNLRDALEAETDEVAGFGFAGPVRNMTFTMGFNEIKMDYPTSDPKQFGKIPDLRGGFKDIID